MCVHPALPIEGVDIILGNNLAGSHVWANGPSSLSVTGKPDESAQCFPDVFTAWAVTLATCRAESEPELAPEQGEAEKSWAFSFALLFLASRIERCIQVVTASGWVLSCPLLAVFFPLFQEVMEVS